MKKHIEEVGVSSERLEGLSGDQVADLVKFLRQAELKGMGRNTRRNYTYSVASLGEFVKKPYKKVTKKDFESWLLTKGLASRPTMLAQLRGFYRVIYGGKLPKFLESLSVQVDRRKLPVASLNHLVSRDELKALVDNCTNQRDRALLYLLYDSAGRISEVLALKVGDLDFDDRGIRVILKGKTGERAIRLTMCHKHVQQWLRNHPYANDHDAYLFPATGRNAPISAGMVRLLLNKAKKKAGIKKRLHPHLFRHSRLTELAGKLPEYLLKQYAGWTMDSHMSSKYIHLDGTALDEALAGFVEEDVRIAPQDTKEQFEELLDMVVEENKKAKRRIRELEEKLELLFDSYGQVTGQIGVEE